MSLKPIILYGHKAAPNPWKVVIILEELSLPFEHKFLDMFKDVKEEPYISVNPNGRLPAIEDPNTGATVFESGACIDYLVDTYDKTGSLVPTDSKKKWLARSWRDVQMSGQGPYYGQAFWFSIYHPEKLPSAIERYQNEIKRVIGMTEAHLAKHKTAYLVGNEVTYADLMFVPWNIIVHSRFEGEDLKKDYPNWGAWTERLLARPAVKKAIEQRTQASKQ